MTNDLVPVDIEHITSLRLQGRRLEAELLIHAHQQALKKNYDNIRIESKKNYYHISRLYCRRKHICTNCWHRPAETERMICLICKEKRQVLRIERRARRVKLKHCVLCDKPLGSARTLMCRACLKRTKAYNKRYQRNIR